ncbi:MAG: exodeoxyribonuclease VII large subunit [Gammaproteobacteria bacterium]|nr:exodeoxyribonuclease VII large subunit [Gammaproteobacteria bacterium]
MIINAPKALTVSQLNRRVRRWLEEDIGPIAVEGEVSNLSRPASGHAYFSLKDTSAQLRCVFFKNRHRQNTNDILQHGQALILQGTLSVYEARGDYQLIVEHIEAAGAGTLSQQFEALKLKLKSLGLFDLDRKKTWPKYPNTIGLITSPTGAAIRDMQSTLLRRFPLTKVQIYPSDVQGAQAPAQLICAIQKANLDANCDVLLLARGGGSLEDLWAFNDEALAHAIAASTIPIISGVGHETDFTIADFVADLRAATPTAAAEAATPDQHQLNERLNRLNLRLETALNRIIAHQVERLNYLSERIKSPKRMLEAHWQTLDYLTRQLQSYMSHKLTQKQHALEQLTTTLNALSPLSTLNRGYAIASTKTQIIREPLDAPIGSEIKLKLAKGALTCKVTQHG